MIFSGYSKTGESHIGLILTGKKTQTRRPSNRYVIGRTYAIQPGRCKASVGRIRILDMWMEVRETTMPTIRTTDALAEGGYTPVDYETLYRYLYPHWETRWCYRFEVVR
jgi:hypothetical protein